MTNQHTAAIATLTVLSFDHECSTYYLTEPTFTIGRASICNLVIPRTTVSRLHAKIEYDGLRYMLHDMTSANGTFVNSERIGTPHLLHHEDRIGLGVSSADVSFQDPDPTTITTNQLRYDLRKHSFFLNRQQLTLTPFVSRLLLYLYEHAGVLCTREDCATAIWGHEFDPGRDGESLDRIVSNLRAALQEIDSDYKPIQTLRGQGYTLKL